MIFLPYHYISSFLRMADYVLGVIGITFRCETLTRNATAPYHTFPSGTPPCKTPGGVRPLNTHSTFLLVTYWPFFP